LYRFFIKNASIFSFVNHSSSVLAADILISPMPPEMAVIKELERGTLSMLSDLQSLCFTNTTIYILRIGQNFSQAALGLL
jgi:cellulose biosynthesis protein BcsQ